MPTGPSSQFIQGLILREKNKACGDNWRRWAPVLAQGLSQEDVDPNSATPPSAHELRGLPSSWASVSASHSRVTTRLLHTAAVMMSWGLERAEHPAGPTGVTTATAVIIST